MRRCRMFLSFRKLTATRVAFLLFMAGLIFLATLQLNQRINQLTVSSAKIVDKKTAPVDINKVAYPEQSHVEDKKAKEQATRLIGNGRSPKQVNEEPQSKDSQNVDATSRRKEDGLVVERLNHTEKRLNHTVQSIGFREQPSPVEPLPSLNGPNSLQLLQSILMKVNKAQTIYNQDKFPPLDENSLVLIVQVHKREGYLKQLLESLKVAKGIEKVLLVISHDYYYDDMNKLIRSIDFCPVMQIFYPFSLQVMPSVFPGAAPLDCPRDATREGAKKMGCTNAEHPDSYGHYREAIVTAIKHHWWWKINMVFDNLRVTHGYNGYVLFLEEDHYVAPDFLQVTNQLIQLKKDKCPDCDFINLGMYNKVRILNNRVSVGVWNAGKNNMGFGMDRQTWDRIRNCSQYFCSYDDYNWDWSINQLGSACSLINRDLKVMVLRSPRIFHIGTCGTHHHKKCNEAQQAAVARDLLTRQSTNLFPSSLTLDAGRYPPPARKRIKPYGGWGDTRDHELCGNFAEKGKLLELKLPT